jgi:hypothetical protein
MRLPQKWGITCQSRQTMRSLSRQGGAARESARDRSGLVPARAAPESPLARPLRHVSTDVAVCATDGVGRVVSSQELIPFVAMAKLYDLPLRNPLKILRD